MAQGIASNQTDVLITSAVISNDRLSETNRVDIAKVITDITIYEHIGKPYITADILFLDQENILQDIDFQGGEKLTITMVHSENKLDGFEIEKEFLIDYIKKVVKTDERNEAIFAHCIEYHTFESSVQNISRAYTGKPSVMISKICDEYLGKIVEVDGDDAISNMKVVVPNLHPLEACLWLKNRTNSSTGTPFYLYSTLALNKIMLKDLGSMLTQKPINTAAPYVYAPSVQASPTSVQRFYAIQEFAYEKSDNLLKLIRDGLVGSQYKFIDTMTGTTKKVDFRVDDDVFFNLAQENILGGDNKKFVYGPEYAVKNKKISSYNSTVISEISSTGAYKQGSTDFRSYNDFDKASEHKRKIIGKALQNFLAKAPISITVNGREFITGDANYSIGQVIRIIFLDNTQERGENRPIIDTKKSGDYIICGAKHVIKYERFDSVLLCGKLASFGDEVTF